MKDDGRNEESVVPLTAGASGFKWFICGVIRDIFIASLLLFIFLELMEYTWPRSVSLFFNINIILAVVLATGTIALLFGALPASGVESRKGRWEPDEIVARLAVYSLGVLVTLLMACATSELGVVRYLVAVAVGAIVVIVSLSLLWDREVALSRGISAGTGLSF